MNVRKRLSASYINVPASIRIRRAFLFACFILISLAATVCDARAQDDAASKKNLAQLTWTDPTQAAKDDPDFLVQGEYGSIKKPLKWGLQIVALGGGAFDGYLLEDGLPGAGWTPDKRRLKLSGERGQSELKLNGSEHSATVSDDRAQVYAKGELVAELPRLARSSPTLGDKPPKDAVVLFDGTTAAAWVNGKVEDGLLPNSNVMTKQKFGSYSLHLEFRTPYKPYARNQQRGNSGVYHQGRYETQVLDSFGLEGKQNECGGIYSIAVPLTNACLPPLSWQTYDVDFKTASFDGAGELIKPAQITVRLNGILVHENQELPHTTTAAPIKTITKEPGPIFIQHHNNPVYYRNIWIVPK